MRSEKNVIVGLAILILLCVSPSGFAMQINFADRPVTGMLSGRVYDAETLQPLEFTDVFFDSLQIGTATRADGSFDFRTLEPGTYRLIVRRIGYEPYAEANLNIAAGTALFRSIALKPTAVKAEEVTVTATRREQTAQMAPASVYVMNSREFRERSIVTFDQALDMVPGVSVLRTSGISVQSLSIRGSSDVAGGGVGNRVLLLIDGRPALSSDTGGALWSLVPTNFIEHVEVVKGAFSSLYGSTAMGGVVNVITRRPTYKALTTVDVKYGFFTLPSRGADFTDGTPTQSVVEVSHSGNRNRVGYLFNLSYKQSDGYTENTAFGFYNAYGKLLFDLRQNRNLEISANYSSAKNDFPHTWMSNLQPNRVLPKYRDDRQEKQVYSVDALYRAVPGKNSKYSSRFYYYRNASRSFYNENDPNYEIPNNQPFGLQTWVNADKFGNTTQADFALGENHYLISGLDVQIDKVASDPDSVMYGDRQVNNLALYVQDEWQVSQKLVAAAGLRYDLNQLVGGKALTQISPKLSAVYHPNKSFAMRFLFGQAFRAPSIAERFFQVELSGGTLFKPNPDLRAERMDLSLETGLRWRINSMIDLDVAYFRYHYRDMIYWVEISAEEGVVYTLFQVRNLNKARMQGLELTTHFNWNSTFNASLGYTYLDAKDLSEGRLDDLLAYRIRHSVHASATANLGRFTLNVNGRYRARVEEVFLYPREAPDAYFVLDAMARVRAGNKVHFSVAVHNMFSAKYEELARYRAAGRNWLFGTTVRF